MEKRGSWRRRTGFGKDLWIGGVFHGGMVQGLVTKEGGAYTPRILATRDFGIS
jgi:hypothetical protein